MSSILASLELSSLNNSFFSIHTNLNESILTTSCIVPLKSQEVVKIGRSKSCNIQVESDYVSLLHGILWSVQFDEDTPPLFYLNDSSRNGIIHNHAEIGSGRTVILEDGDIIELKLAAKFVFKCIRYEIHCLINFESMIEGWEVSNKLIGSGSFGSVYVANKQNTKSLFAVKIIPNAHSSYFPSSNSNKKTESSMLFEVRHVCVLFLQQSN